MIKEYLEEFAEIADEWFKKENWFENWFEFYNSFSFLTKKLEWSHGRYAHSGVRDRSKTAGHKKFVKKLDSQK